MTADDYRFKRAIWYPTNDMKIIDGKEFFHTVTFEMHEIIEKISCYHGFNAWGFFTLGKPLLTSLVANFTTFIIVLIQFKLAE